MLMFLPNLDMGASSSDVPPVVQTFYPDPNQAVWIILDGTDDPL